jgi:hypothetical protein
MKGIKKEIIRKGVRDETVTKCTVKERKIQLFNFTHFKCVFFLLISEGIC